ncbi:MAG: hypothetical protein M1321_00080 [Candidatus Marsarchaeota archaeon]|jgi:KaiC/GvpD/RAD55 family RecA-like ATPase|nr:hypothetical protein [Candidatus Marsarchaeota archaeon]
MGNVGRVKTGIPGFDELIEGGIPQGFNVLITGTPGTGKTIFGMQYLYNGAMRGENGVYITLDAKKSELIDQASMFGWDLVALEKQGKLSIMEVPMDKVEMDLFAMIEEQVQKVKATRLVFDSLINFAINIDQFKVPVSFIISNPEVASVMGNEKTYYTGKSEKRITYLLVNELSKLGTTNIVITAAPEGEKTTLTMDGVSEFACDGVVVMYNTLIGAAHAKTMTVLKMRETHNDPYIHDFELNPKGFKVKPAEVYQ